MHTVTHVIMMVLVVIVILLIVTHAPGFSEAAGTVNSGALNMTEALSGNTAAGWTSTAQAPQLGKAA
jgi:type IV secretory pathway VirB2 component (pilin)